MAPSNSDIKKSKKPSYLKRERNKLVRRFENKRYARLKKSVGSDEMGLRIQKFMDDFDKYKLDYQNRLANKQKGGKKRRKKRKTKRKKRKRRRRTRKKITRFI